MSRPRQYATAAERQAAYRRRMKELTIWVDRAPFERMTHAMESLHDALWQGCKQDHPVAHEIYRASAVDTLEAAVTWFVSHVLHADAERR